MSVRTELEVTRELKNVRKLLAEYRARGEDYEGATNILYGAQQALIWLLYKGDSPTRLEEIIREAEEIIQDMAAELEHG